MSKHLELAQWYWGEWVPNNPEKPWRVIEMRLSSGGWITLSNHPAFLEGTEYRRKPYTIMIGGREINAPFREELKQGQLYYMVVIRCGKAAFTEIINSSREIGQKHVATGTVHLTKEAALAHGEALLALTKQELIE